MMTTLSKLLAIALLFCLLPVLMLIGFIIKMKYPGPLFYKQAREGQNGKAFYIWKLRTMIVNADTALALIMENDKEVQKEWQEFGCLRHDPRIAGYAGKLARRLSIDELPQLINIVRGEMAFIGPRPLELFLAQSLDTETRTKRNSVKPGLTGLWQIGPRSSASIRQMQHYDLLYIKKRSFILDMYIAFKTIKVVFKGTGA
jgi:exopolysaccharide production protein ExoY